MGNGNENGGFCENHCDIKTFFCVLLLVFGDLAIYISVNIRVCGEFCSNGGGGLST